MTSQEHSRMTHLKDRRIHAQNDLLYEPLRNALRKSSVSHSLLLTSMSCSRVGKNIRSLSPLEAEIIVSCPLCRRIIYTFQSIRS